jgi:YD repeat-containing protein
VWILAVREEGSALSERLMWPDLVVEEEVALHLLGQLRCGGDLALVEVLVLKGMEQSMTAGSQTTVYGWNTSYGWRTSQGPSGTPNQIQYSYTATGRMATYSNSATNTSATYSYDAAGQRTRSVVTQSGQMSPSPSSAW